MDRTDAGGHRLGINRFAPVRIHLARAVGHGMRL